jgi:hypothetical protein
MMNVRIFLRARAPGIRRQKAARPAARFHLDFKAEFSPAPVRSLRARARLTISQSVAMRDRLLPSLLPPTSTSTRSIMQAARNASEPKALANFAKMSSDEGRRAYH